MIPNERGVIADSLWTATASDAPDYPALEGEARADVAVIGAGYTGLSAALHLAGRGVRAVVLEAEQPGWGASGRNGGQVNPGLKDSPSEIVARFGEEKGRRLIDLAGGAADLVFDLIGRHGIDCDAVRPGWIRAAHTGKALRSLRALAEDWQRLSAPVEPLSRDRIGALLGTGRYVGGILDRRGGNLHPLNYALGLATAAERSGAAIHGRSPVSGIRRRDGRFELAAGRGRVLADKVLVCTNAYSGPLHRGLAASVLPVRSVQVATEPLSDNIRKSILSGRHAVSDSRRLLLYFRLDAHGRFVMGGRGTYGDGSTRRQLAWLRRVSAGLYPQLQDARWSHAWGGYVAITPDHYPHLHELAPGVMAGLGYNGRGVAMATAMGRVMADWAAGTPREALDFPVTDLAPLPMPALHRLGVVAGIQGARVLDWLRL